MLCRQIFQIARRIHLTIIDELFWLNARFHLMITLQTACRPTLCVFRSNFGNMPNKQVDCVIRLMNAFILTVLIKFSHVSVFFTVHYTNKKFWLVHLDAKKKLCKIFNLSVNLITVISDENIYDF